jgi:hypothetical protein
VTPRARWLSFLEDASVATRHVDGPRCVALRTLSAEQICTITVVVSEKPGKKNNLPVSHWSAERTGPPSRQTLHHREQSRAARLGLVLDEAHLNSSLSVAALLAALKDELTKSPLVAIIFSSKYGRRRTFTCAADGLIVRKNGKRLKCS